VAIEVCGKVGLLLRYARDWLRPVIPVADDNGGAQTGRVHCARGIQLMLSQKFPFSCMRIVGLHAKDTLGKLAT